MTTVLQFPGRQEGRVPADTFPIRLAIVRAEMGWNYTQAERETGVGGEAWRLWEKRKRHCTTLEETCRKIADRTGFSYRWLMVGGELGGGTVPPDTSTLGSVRPENNNDYSRLRMISTCTAA